MIAADFIISKNYKESQESAGEMEVWNDIYKGNIKADIAVYGSSRAWVHFSPNILKDSLDLDTYNFGIDGHNFWLQYLRHKEYIKFNRPPKYIILSVDIFTLLKRKDLYQFNQFLPYMLWNKNIFDYTSSYNGFDYLDYYLPLIRYYGNIVEFKGLLNFSQLEDKKNHYRDKGYRGMDREWKNDLTATKLKISDYNVNLDPDSVDLLDKFLAEAKKSNIEVILVYSPEYVTRQKFIKNRKKVVDIFNFYAKKYNLHYIDYSNDKLSSQKEYFYDTSHLNKKGSELFSSKLSSDLKEFMNVKDYR